MMPSKISDIGEKLLIKRLLSKSKNPRYNSFLDYNSIKSLSDDAALINIGDHYLVACSDMLLQSTHFPKEMDFYQIGKKIVTVNVSDLAAMGAEAIGIIISMGLPKNMLLTDFDDLIDGILDNCNKYEMALIGGDTNESSQLTLTGTCLGIVKKKNVMMKTGIHPGDIVAVTGPLGLAAAGFITLLNPCHDISHLKENVINLVKKHALEPEAKLKEGIILAKTNSTSSATDITDGLFSELGELIDANNNKIGFIISQEDLPIPKEVFDIAKLTGNNAMDMATTYGEDFELLITIPTHLFNNLKTQISIYKIGLVDSSGEIKIIDKKGNTNIITPQGYEHLK
ncbi:MAG: thiamine-phosphate kinase [Methanobacterium sp.]|nr:thiamine-phosphate kinase [Methanobacterium sp.]